MTREDRHEKQVVSAALAALDRKLAHWAATDRYHKEEVLRLEAIHKWLDASPIQRQAMLAGAKK